MMNSEEFLSMVLAPAHPDEQQRVLLSLLERPYAEAQALPTETERRNAHLKHILHTKALIETLVGPQLLARATAASRPGSPADGPALADAGGMDTMMQRFRLAHAGGAYFFSVLEKVRHEYRHRVARREFRDELCGAYPWRDAQHAALHVRPACEHSAPSALGHRYPWSLAEPYARANTAEAARAELYQSRLRVRTLTAADLQSPGEQGLIGQRGVFAHARIPAGSCVGVYGGQLLDRADLFILQDDRYLISASSTPGDKGINGENMMAMMNTHYLLDAQGQVVGHPPTGYNVEPAAFTVETLQGEPLIIHAYFATCDIDAGEELRWNYNSGRLASAAQE
ncbi:MAG TPA: SET domain-containing protein-lysine N-methyltransferase [Roseateles sp.]